MARNIGSRNPENPLKRVVVKNFKTSIAKTSIADVQENVYSKTLFLPTALKMDVLLSLFWKVFLNIQGSYYLEHQQCLKYEQLLQYRGKNNPW